MRRKQGNGWNESHLSWKERKLLERRNEKEGSCGATMDGSERATVLKAESDRDGERKRATPAGEGDARIGRDTREMAAREEAEVQRNGGPSKEIRPVVTVAFVEDFCQLL